MTTDAGIIGRRIRLLRMAKGWTQSELAAKTGVKLNQVHAWEKGRHVPMLQRRPIVAQVFGVQPEVLFCVGEERDFVMEETAANVMLTVARKEDASPTQRLSAIRSMRLNASAAKGNEDAMVEFRRMMQDADDDLTRILAEIEAEEA